MAQVLGSYRKRELRLTKSSTHSGRLLLAPDKALANARLILHVRGLNMYSSQVLPDPVLLSTDNNGRFEHAQQTKSAWLLVALLDESARHGLATDGGIPVARHAIMGAHGGKLLENDDEIDLSRLRRIEITVKKADGSPASFAYVDCFSFGSFNVVSPMVQMRTNRRGSLVMLLGNCKSMLVVAHNERGYAARSLNALADKTELVLGGILEYSGVLEDAKGRPLPGAIAKVDTTSRRQFKQAGMSALARGFKLNIHLAHHLYSKSDEAGRFSLWIPESIDSFFLSLSPPGAKTSAVRTIEMNGRSHRGVRLVIE